MLKHMASAIPAFTHTFIPSCAFIPAQNILQCTDAAHCYRRSVVWCMCVCGTRLRALQNGWTDPPELMAQSVRIILSESCQAVWIESRDRLAKSEQLADRSYHIMYICLPDQNAYQTRPHRTGLASGVYWTKSKHKLILIHSSYNTSQVDHLNTNSSLIHIIFLRPLLREPRPWMHYKSQPSAKTPRKKTKITKC